MQMRNANIATGMIIREKAAHSVHSFKGKANHSTGTDITCASNEAGVSLQHPADQANLMDVSNSC